MTEATMDEQAEREKLLALVERLAAERLELQARIDALTAELEELERGAAGNIGCLELELADARAWASTWKAAAKSNRINYRAVASTVVMLAPASAR